MSLPPYLSIKTPHDCVQYVLFARHMSNKCRKIKTTQTLQNKVSEFTKLESLFEPHLKAIVSYTN